MIRSCLELMERIFEVAHGTVALFDTTQGQLVRSFPSSLPDSVHILIAQRAAPMTGRVGEFKPLTSLHDVALLGIDSSKVLVVAPKALKDGQLAQFELQEIKYLNLILETYASTISYDLINAPRRVESEAVTSEEAPEVEQTPGDKVAWKLSVNKQLKELFAPWHFELKSDSVKYHNPYRVEQAIKEAVRLGDLRLLQHAFAIPQSGREGCLAADELRSLKNHANLVNVICSRAAIDGGVSYEDSFRLSDQLFWLVESLTNCDKAFEVRYTIAQAFTLLVQHHLHGHQAGGVNLKVQQAMLYIRQHIYDKVTVAEVAQAVNCHRNYLQRLFKRDTTFSVISFIRAEKIKVVKELLAHSDESVSNIAALLNFSSSSHLCHAFKELVHLTPEQYRKSHRAVS